MHFCKEEKILCFCLICLTLNYPTLKKFMICLTFYFVLILRMFTKLILRLHTIIIFKLPERAEIEFSIKFSAELFIKDLYFKSEGF